MAFIGWCAIIWFFGFIIWAVVTSVSEGMSEEDRKTAKLFFKWFTIIGILAIFALNVEPETGIWVTIIFSIIGFFFWIAAKENEGSKHDKYHNYYYLNEHKRNQRKNHRNLK